MVDMYEDKRNPEELQPCEKQPQKRTLSECMLCKAQGGPNQSKKRVLVPLHLSMTYEELLSQDLTDDPTDAEFQVSSVFNVRLKQELHESAIKAGLRTSTHISAIKQRAREQNNTLQS